MLRYTLTWGCVAVVIGASSVVAGPLGLDANGMAGFTGSSNYTNGALTATVDYAVFAPGTFPGNDPSNGHDYVYAYQLFNTSATRSVDTFSVGLLANHGAHNPGHDATYPLTGGVAPILVELGSDSVVADLTGPAVGPGHYSSVIVFTSPYEPVMYNTSILSGTMNAISTAPTPTPEPTGALLAVTGGAGWLVRRRRAR